MDPRRLFTDERLRGFCVYCGGAPESRDHCPSKVLLDEPFPLNLPVVEACRECNNNFSLDEQYVACLIEAVACGSTNANNISRLNIKRILKETLGLAARLESSKRVDKAGNLLWEVDVNRVKRVLLKLARGHIAYELSLPKIEEPDTLSFIPLILVPEEERFAFESPASSSVRLWPEIGSRAFIMATKGLPVAQNSCPGCLLPRSTTAVDCVKDAGSCPRKTIFAGGDAYDCHR
jgi:hypothetical protein